MKVYAIGIARNYGRSVKKDPKGKDYDMCSLLCLTPIEPGSGTTSGGGTYTREGYGYQVTEFDATPDCVAQFKDIKFPAHVEVMTDSEPKFGRMVTVISGIITSSLKPVSSAA